MLTPYEQRKLILELFYLKPGLNIPERSESRDIADLAVRNELKTLKRSNDRMRRQISDLEDRNKELEDYAHTIAHNLKNPLSVVILTADALMDIGDLTKAELDDYMKQIRTTAYEMDDTIDNLLLLSEVRKVDAPLESIDMGKSVANVRRRLSNLLREYQGTILAPADWPPAIGYAPWIEEVWSNYLSNAIKYGGRPPVIRLGATKLDNGMINFWVLDNGVGIPAGIQTQLFSPFGRLNLNHQPGHGVGLSIVRHIVEKLGGKVGVESKAGKGSLFFFTLPSAESENAGKPAQA